MDAPKIAILVSGEGTTAEAVITASAAGEVNFLVDLVISNNENAGIFKRVAQLNKKYDMRIKCLLADSDTEIQKLLDKHQPDLIVLMGYMKKVGAELVHNFGWRVDYTRPEQAMMLNTHPGLLPATKGQYGIHVQQYVLDNQLPYGGQTLHVVSENYDEGPTVAEHKVSVIPGDTPNVLFDRVRIVEKQYLPSDIEEFLKKRKQYLKKNG